MVTIIHCFLQAHWRTLHSYTWMDISEAVQRQALGVQADLQLDSGRLDVGVGQKPAVLLPRN